MKTRDSVRLQDDLERNWPSSQEVQLPGELAQEAQPFEHAEQRIISWSDKAKKKRQRTIASRARKELTLTTGGTTTGDLVTSGAVFRTF